LKKLKILTSCYACSPNRGSEPGMGWNFVKGLSEFHEVHVITEQEKWEADITLFLEQNPVLKKNLHFHFIRKKRNRKLRKIWPPSYYWFYKQWQKKAYLLAQQLDIREDFDIIHQLNMVGFREPGYLWKIKKAFVWGPIGGMKNTPWNFFSEFDLHGKLFYGSRNIFNSIQTVVLARPKKAAKRERNKLIAATPDIKKTINQLWGQDPVVITEVGSKKSVQNSIKVRNPDEVLNIGWSGQHTAGKALNILLKSLSKLPNEIKWKLDILGTGQMTENWKSLSENLKISSNCNWHGWLPREEAIGVMIQAHLFCITSLKDLTSTVTLEALSFGVPIICLDHCGFAHVVNETCGIKIPINTPKQAIQGFSDAIEIFYNNEPLRQKMANGALTRSQDFSWSGKINKINIIYSNLLDENINNS
jgi:glycosyltransferase involved in cell wall biosynthesis